MTKSQRSHLLSYAILAIICLIIANIFSTQLNTTAQFNPEYTIVSTTTGKCQARQVNVNDEQAWLPDPNCTPGTLNPDVMQANIDSTICRSGYTKTIRPSTSYTNKLKIQGIQDYGYSDTNLKNYEEDHHISLELGGNGSDPRNLWPEPHGSMNEKDKVENYLHAQVCAGKMTLQEAQYEISQNWYSVYELIGPLTP